MPCTILASPIKKGEFVFLTGASGAGKTTLLKLIFKEELPNKRSDTGGFKKYHFNPRPGHCIG